MKRQQPLPNFDRIARPYRWMEYLTFGRALERCRNHFLRQIASCRNALVLGDGDGRFLAALLTANPHLQADAVDLSSSMLQLLTHRAYAAHPTAISRLRTHQTSALAFAPSGPYDLVGTHFFLDCLTQPELNSLVDRLIPHLTPNARWLVSDFRIPLGPLHLPARVLTRTLYLAFRILTGLSTTQLPDHAAVLSTARFTRTAQRLSFGGLLTTEIWEYTPAMLPPQRPKTHSVPDPVPDPEPASPSLPEPDPGVFQHEPVPPAKPPAGACLSGK